MTTATISNVMVANASRRQQSSSSPRSISLLFGCLGGWILCTVFYYSFLRPFAYVANGLSDSFPNEKQPSLSAAIAAAFFFLNPQTGYITFPNATKQVVIDVGARESDYLQRQLSLNDNTTALILFDPLPHSYIPVVSDASSYQMRNRHEDGFLEVNNMNAIFTVRAALGEKEGTTEFNVGIAPACSTLLEFNLSLTPHWCMASTSKMSALVLRLENVLRMIPPWITEIHLKVDTEGMDLGVLKGAGSQIHRLATVIIETKIYLTREEMPPGVFNASDASEYMAAQDFLEIFPPSQPHGENQFWVRRGWNLPGNELPKFFAEGLSFHAFYNHLGLTMKS